MRNLAALVLVALALSGCGSRAGTGNCASGAHFTASDATLEFGEVSTYEYAERTVTLALDCTDVATPLTLKAVPDSFTVDLGGATLSPGAQHTVTITFIPTAYTEFSGDVVIEASATAQKTVVIHVHGTGREVDIDTDPHELDFGVVRVGASSTLSMTIPNLEDRLQHVAISSDDPAFTIEPDSLDLAANSSAKINVTFSPASRGAFVGPHLHLRFCPTCNEILRTVKGVGAIEDFSLTPDPLDFGTHSPGSTACQDVTIRNTGDVPILFSAATPDPYFTQSGAFDLQIGNLLDGSTRLEVKATTSVTVCFSPKAIAKDYDGKIGFNTLDNDYQSLPVHGRGGGSSIVCEPDHLDFGVSTPTSQVTRNVVCKNLGAPEDVFLQGLTADQPETVRLDTSQDGDPMDFNVGRADYHFSATFTASVPGDYASSVRLTFAKADGIEVELQLPVTGTIVDGVPCTLSVPSAVNFGLVGYGGIYNHALKIENTSPSSGCIVWGFALDGKQSRYYSVDGMPTGITTIAPRTILDLTVAYQPMSPSSSPDTQTLTFNQLTGSGQDPAVKVPISGFGTPSLGLAVYPDPIDFDLIPSTYVKHLAVNVINMSAEHLEVSGNIGVTSDSPSAFGVSNLPAHPPETVPVGAVLSFEATFAPTSVGDASGTLEIWLKDAVAPILVPMLGYATNNPCGVLCGQPQASCPSDQTTWISTPVQLTGEGFDQTDPAGTGVTCHWDLLAAPATSMAVADSSDACITGFLPDVAGTYGLELTVKNGSGDTATCTTQVYAKTP